MIEKKDIERCIKGTEVECPEGYELIVREKTDLGWPFFNRHHFLLRQTGFQGLKQINDEHGSLKYLLGTVCWEQNGEKSAIVVFNNDSKYAKLESKFLGEVLGLSLEFKFANEITVAKISNGKNVFIEIGRAFQDSEGKIWGFNWFSQNACVLNRFLEAKAFENLIRLPNYNSARSIFRGLEGLTDERKKTFYEELEKVLMLRGSLGFLLSEAKDVIIA